MHVYYSLSLATRILRNVTIALCSPISLCFCLQRVGITFQFLGQGLFTHFSEYWFFRASLASLKVTVKDCKNMADSTRSVGSSNQQAIEHQDISTAKESVCGRNNVNDGFQMVIELDETRNTLYRTGSAGTKPGHGRVYKQVREPSRYHNGSALCQPSIGLRYCVYDDILESSQVKTRNREFFYEVRAHPGPLQRFFLYLSHAPGYDKALDLSLSPLETATEGFCSCVIFLGCFVSSILGGMATLTLLQVHLFNVKAWGNIDIQMLQLYSPQALFMNRLYWVLIMIALCNAVCRYESCNATNNVHEICTAAHYTKCNYSKRAVGAHHTQVLLKKMWNTLIQGVKALPQNSMPTEN
jgi:hypothetical protein